MLDEAGVRRFDKEGAAEHLKTLPVQVERGFKQGLAFGPLAANRRVVVIGMGGSGIAGAVLGAWLAATRRTPVASVNDSRLPPWVGRGDLVIAVSYSGNTLETLAAAREAIARDSDLVGIASGGTLRDLCHGKGLPYVAVPPGLTPRAAFGFLFGGLAALFPDTTDEMEIATEWLRVKNKALTPNVGESKNRAKKLATRMKGRTPIVYGTPTYAPVARRWQTQFNENAKVLAWASVLPEADHNELVGWAGDPAAKRFFPIFLRDPEEPDDHRAMMEATIDLIRGRARVQQVMADGETLLARMLTTIQLGDWASLYLAVLRKVNPTPVAVIAKLKQRLAKG